MITSIMSRHPPTVRERQRPRSPTFQKESNSRLKNIRSPKTQKSKSQPAHEANLKLPEDKRLFAIRKQTLLRGRNSFAVKIKKPLLLFPSNSAGRGILQRAKVFGCLLHRGGGLRSCLNFIQADSPNLGFQNRIK